MNNEHPIGKASMSGKFFRESLPPKQKIIYEITNKNNSWDIVEIDNHKIEISKLLDKSAEVLGLL
jgi:hypothetical protein